MAIEEEHRGLSPAQEVEEVASAERRLESRFQRFQAATLLTALMAVVVSIAALAVGLSKTTGGTTVITTAAAQKSTAPVPSSVDVTVAGGVKKGPDGKPHDAYSVTNFNVHVGQPLTLRITNKDDASHSITAQDAGVNIVAQPGTHTYTLVVQKAGTFHWMCVIPCDSDANGWAMTHDGYMAGTITAS